MNLDLGKKERSLNVKTVENWKSIFYKKIWTSLSFYFTFPLFIIVIKIFKIKIFFTRYYISQLFHKLAILCPAFLEIEIPKTTYIFFSFKYNSNFLFQPSTILLDNKRTYQHRHNKIIMKLLWVLSNKKVRARINIFGKQK